jgi:hypothetical protein
MMIFNSDSSSFSLYLFSLRFANGGGGESRSLVAHRVTDQGTDSNVDVGCLTVRKDNIRVALILSPNLVCQIF